MRNLLESEIQESIVTALQLAGLTVYSTSTHRQKGPSGCDRGIPDLLVCSSFFPHVYLGIEVKKPKGWTFSSPEQKQAYAEARFRLVHSPEEALDAAAAWVDEMTRGDAPAYDVLRNKLRSVRKSLGGQ